MAIPFRPFKLTKPFDSLDTRLERMDNSKKCGKGWIPDGSKCHSGETKPAPKAKNPISAAGYDPNKPKAKPDNAWKQAGSPGAGTKPAPAKPFDKAAFLKKMEIKDEPGTKYTDLPADMLRGLSKADRAAVKGTESAKPFDKAAFKKKMAIEDSPGTQYADLPADMGGAGFDGPDPYGDEPRARTPEQNAEIARREAGGAPSNKWAKPRR
jgi:hypothetical protein